MKVSELKALPPKILLYGPPGRGKTALVMTLGDELELIDLDANPEVAFGLSDNLQEQRLNVNIHQFIDDDPNKGTAFMRARKHLIGISNDCKKGTYPYKYLAVDSLTALAVAAQNMVMGNAGRIGKNPEIQHWGLLLNEIEHLISIVRSLPITVIVIAHETTFVADDISQIQIAIPGQKLPGKITRMFSEIWYTRMRDKGGGKQQFYLQTAPTSSITCRSGKGLKNGLVFGTSNKDGLPGESVSMAEIIEQIQPEGVKVEVEKTTA